MLRDTNLLLLNFASNGMLKIFLLAVLFLTAPILTGPHLFDAPKALADDHDDDDDDDDDDSGNSGSGSKSSGKNSSGNSSSSGIFQNNDDPGHGITRKLRRKSLKRNPRRRAGRPATTQLRQFAPREIVALDLTDAQIERLVEQRFTVLQRDLIQSLGTMIVRFRIPRGMSLINARAVVNAINPGAAADFNHYYRTGSSGISHQSAPQSDCRGNRCFAPLLIDWPGQAGLFGSCRSDVRIGIIDTGINPDHEAFAGRRLEVLSAVEENARPSGLVHGTAVAAILLGTAESRSPGLLPDAELIAVDVFQRASARDERSDVYTLVKAMDMLWQRGVKVVNMSLAGPSNILLERQVNRLHQDGVVIVAAAGNGGPRAKPAYPGAYGGVFAITAIDANRNVYRRAARGAHIDFAAPGVGVWTAASVRGSRQKTGTSFAAPFVTAIVALVQAGGDVRGYDDVAAILSASAEDLGRAGKDDIFGFGLVQATGLCR